MKVYSFKWPILSTKITPNTRHARLKLTRKDLPIPPNEPKQNIMLDCKAQIQRIEFTT